MPYVVGLTGGIGAGKSTVADLFKALGVEIVDADKISHKLTTKGKNGFIQIIQNFGAEYIDTSGNLNREKLRETVFKDNKARQKLESLLHPLINQEMDEMIKRSSAPYILLVIPLLLETGNYHALVDRILVVDCDEQQQIDRVMQRSNLSPEQVRSIMAAQIPRSARLKQADDIIINNSDLNSLEKQVKALHNLYTQES